MSKISNDIYYILSTSLKLPKIQITRHPPPKFLIKSFSGKDTIAPHFMIHYERTQRTVYTLM